MQALVILVLALGAMAAAGFEIWLATTENPRRFRYAWLAWTPLAMLAVAAMSWSSDPGEALILALVAGPAAYPFFRAAAWLRFNSHSHAEEHAKDLERMEYHALDFGGPPASHPAAPAGAQRPPPETVTAQPMATTPPASVLARATTEKRSPWAKRLEWAVIGFACFMAASSFLGFYVWDAFISWGYDPGGAVIETLEQRGHGAPRIESANGQGFCADGDAFAWSAVGSRGRACVDGYSGYISLWVDQRWPALQLQPALAGVTSATRRPNAIPHP